MTIPIIPGPFSFLQSIGQGAANYQQAREERRRYENDESRRDRAEAFSKLGFLFRGIQTGDIDAKTVRSPLFQQLIQQAGLGEGLGEGVVPVPEATTRRAQTAALEERLPQLGPTGRGILAKTGQAPLPSEIATENVNALAKKIAERRISGTLTPAQEEAISGVPGATSATAAVQGGQSPEIGATADQIVNGLAAKLGRVPTVQEAVQYGATDVRARGFGADLNESAYGAAIRRYNEGERKLAALEKTAESRYISAGDTPADVLRTITAQQTIIKDRIAKREAQITELMGKKSALGKMGVPQFGDIEIDNQIKSLRDENATDTEEWENLGRQGNEVKAGRLPGAEGGLAEKRNAWDRAAKAIKANPGKYGFSGTPTDEEIAEYLEMPRP